MTSDQKPLRQEDYQAMAEENRRLQEELAATKQTKLKKEKPVRSIKIPWSTIGSVSIIGAVVGSIVCLITLPVMCDNDALKAKTVCAFASQYEGHADPWDKWSVWKRSKGRFSHEQHIDKEFSTRDEALVWLKQWNIPECK